VVVVAKDVYDFTPQFLVVLFQDRDKHRKRSGLLIDLDSISTAPANLSEVRRPKPLPFRVV